MINNLYRIIAALIMLVVLALTGCESEIIEPIDTSDLPDVVSFNDHIVPIFNNNCVQCHGGQTPPDLSQTEAYLNLTAGGLVDLEEPENSKIYEEITVGNMEQYASDLDKAYILKWIQQGAEEN